MNSEAVNRNRKRAGFWATTIAVGALVAGIITVGVTAGGEEAEAEPLPVPAATNPIIADPDGPHESTIWDAQVWAKDAFGEFNAVTHHGSGNALIELPEGAQAGVLTARNTGDGEFALTMRGPALEVTGDQPVMTTGAYQGTTVWGVHNTADAAYLQVISDGDWSVTIAPMSAARVMHSTGDGIGDTVFLWDGDARALNAAHHGNGEFAITGYTEDPIATVGITTHRGPYTGTIHLGSSPAVIAVTAVGSWTVGPQ
ncbi:hypothetical protein [Gryllotalpicola protaetiae]|uniref:Uncharacterized protein n=1 Tax=Gryllotalpicola protaetiae TaxID=2419771 RepID=A0A387BHU4_9MICO|nr:hypothetical protein [Gryllotalpicola protaetiae]AYG03605.1 hypothetical protein D7I44_08710 [Gryllotalpicola protaetiae]